MALLEEVWEGFEVLSAQADVVLVVCSSTFGYVITLFCVAGQFLIILIIYSFVLDLEPYLDQMGKYCGNSSHQ